MYILAPSYVLLIRPVGSTTNRWNGANAPEKILLILLLPFIWHSYFICVSLYTSDVSGLNTTTTPTVSVNSDCLTGS